MIEKSTGRFNTNTNFNTIIERYEFDKKLRNILFDAIEIVEVGLRTKFITTLSLATNTGLWYLDNSLFENQQFHTNLVLDMKYEFNRNKMGIDEHKSIFDLTEEDTAHEESIARAERAHIGYRRWQNE